jgi:hypothetical protein
MAPEFAGARDEEDATGVRIRFPRPPRPIRSTAVDVVPCRPRLGDETTGAGCGIRPLLAAPARVVRGLRIVSSDALETRQFVVVAYDDDQRRGELEDVQAASHEEAVAQIAASRPLTEVGAVYEVWPAQEPGCILRVTLEPPRPRPPIP